MAGWCSIRTFNGPWLTMHLREWIIIELFSFKKKTWLESFPRFWINSKVPTPTSAPKFTQNSGTSPVAHRLKCSLSLAHTSIFKVPSWNRYQRGGLHRPKDMAFLFPWMVLYSHRSLDHLCSFWGLRVTEVALQWVHARCRLALAQNFRPGNQKWTCHL